MTLRCHWHRLCLSRCLCEAKLPRNKSLRWASAVGRALWRRGVRKQSGTREDRKANVCSQSKTACSLIPMEFGAKTEPQSWSQGGKGASLGCQPLAAVAGEVAPIGPRTASCKLLAATTKPSLASIRVHLMAVVIILNYPHNFQTEPVSHPIAKTVTRLRHLFWPQDLS